MTPNTLRQPKKQHATGKHETNREGANRLGESMHFIVVLAILVNATTVLYEYGGVSLGHVCLHTTRTAGDQHTKRERLLTSTTETVTCSRAGQSAVAGAAAAAAAATACAHRRVGLHRAAEGRLRVRCHRVGLVQYDHLKRGARVPRLVRPPPHRHLHHTNINRKKEN